MHSNAEEISDLELETLVINPGEVARVPVTISSDQAPRGRSGKLDLEYQCRPKYNGDVYRGVIVCRDHMQTKVDIIVRKHQEAMAWTIEPSRKGAVRRDGGAENAEAVEETTKCEKKK